MQENKTYKLQGELVELRFLARAAELGLRVSKPYGDSAPYDFLVESGGTVFKVQVKSTRFQSKRCKAFMCVTGAQRRRYRKEEVDFIAAYVVTDDTWYIIPLGTIPGCHISLNPRFRRNKWRDYREAWDLLIPEHHRHWKRKPKPRRDWASRATHDRIQPGT
jgi:hypothetical protein